MKIDGIAMQVPDRVITNEDLVQKFIAKNYHSLDNELDSAVDRLYELFQSSGLETRRWLHEKEPWFPYLRRAIENALNMAGKDLGDIDCVIYSSVYKTVLEPSMAALVAKSLGLMRASCFDISEACGGWARSISVANAYLMTGQFKNILLLSNEAFGNDTTYGKDALGIKTIEDLEWAFPSYTVGSAATATLLSADESRPWDIAMEAENKFAGYCLYPMSWPEDHEHDMGEFNSKGVGNGYFTCYGRLLQMAGLRTVVKFARKKLDKINAADIFIPHTQSYTFYTQVCRLLNVEPNLYSIYPKYGNVITSSLPATIADALASDCLKREEEIFMLIPASGLSIGAFSFRF